MEYYPDLTLAENYLLNWILSYPDSHGVTADREMILRNFLTVDEEEINQILRGLEEKKYITIQHKKGIARFLESYSKGRNKTNETFDISINYKKVYKKYKNTEDKNA